MAGHPRQELQKYDQRFTRSRHKVATRALFSRISASTADDDAVAPQVRSRVDGDTLVQVSHASSVLKAWFLVQGFRSEGECRNRSQIDQCWLMILIRCMGQPSISSQEVDIIYVSTRRRPSVNACQYHFKLRLLGPSYFLPAQLIFTYDCPNFVASYDF